MSKEPLLKNVQTIYAGDIPNELQDVCLDINDEFPLHYATGLVQVEDNGNSFSEWLKTIGFKFDEDNLYTWLGVWGT